MKLTEQQKVFTSKLKANLEKITGTNNHLSKTEIIETSINSLFNESELKNKSKTAFQKEMKELIKNQKNEFAKFL